MHPALKQIAHRPWPLPPRPWIMEQTWNDLLFAHWPVPEQMLRPLVPAALALDTFDGECWVAVTPFHMTGVRPAVCSTDSRNLAFPELNVRTYVSFAGKPGVFFFSLDAASRIAVWAARLTYRLPYFFANMGVRGEGDSINYRSSRKNANAELRTQYRPFRAVEIRAPGTLEHWLTERYCLYVVTGSSVFRAEIHHEPWPLQDAEAEFEKNTMAKAAGIELPGIPPVLHFAKQLQVLVWPLNSL